MDKEDWSNDEENALPDTCIAVTPFMEYRSRIREHIVEVMLSEVLDFHARTIIPSFSYTPPAIVH